MELPQDLKRVCQVGAKVYLKDKKIFGKVSYYSTDMVKISIGTTKSPDYIDYTPDEFHTKLTDESLVAGSRVAMADNDSGKVNIKPRVIMEVAQGVGEVINTPMSKTATPELSNMLTGYINESTGNFSKTPVKDYVEIKYQKVTTSLTLKLDSVQLEALKKLGIITDE